MSTTRNNAFDAILLGIHSDGSFASTSASKNASALSEKAVSTLADLWKGTEAKGKQGETRVFWNTPELPKQVALVGLGKRVTPGQGPAGQESALMELTRRAAAAGVKVLRDNGAKNIGVDVMYSAHAAAEGSILGLYKFDRFKTQNKEPYVAPEVAPLADVENTFPSGLSWSTGQVYAEAQNFARDLKETPANLMTPTIFADQVTKAFAGVKNVKVTVHDEAWAMIHKMGSFLSVTHGTDEPCKFLEINYTAGSGKDTELALVGKGITFDSGGISIKPAAAMKEMRADMGGAAAVASATLAIAKLGIPISMVTTIPLTENMPSGKATKPGDIVVAMNGKTIEVDNTDAEGRLVLADALYYTSSTYKPKTIIDVATLTGAMMIALGDVHTGAFVSDDSLFAELEHAGRIVNDTFWRMPLDSDYKAQISTSNADLCNTGGRLAGSCTAAIFLREFVAGLPNSSDPVATALENEAPAADSIPRYAHLDIAGTMDNTSPQAPYLRKGMSGRPVRALVEFARNLAASKANL